MIPVACVRTALAQAAARFYPGQPETIVAVTGTSGKTSVAAFVRQIWTALGHAAGALGTTGVVTPAGSLYGSLTTPDPVSLHATLDRLAARRHHPSGDRASSHGLDQHRLDGVRLAAGAFTNLSRDHLDYHPTLDAYLKAKLGLFERLLKPGQPAVIDADSNVAGEVIAAARARGLGIFSTGAAGETIRLVGLEAASRGERLQIAYQDRIFELQLPLPGSFMAANALVAAGLCIATGSDAPDVFPRSSGSKARRAGSKGSGEQRRARSSSIMPISPMRWRTRCRRCGRSPRAALRGLRLRRRPRPRQTADHGRDCGASCRHGHVTDDNPRSETPEKIRAAILAAAPGALGHR